MTTKSNTTPSWNAYATALGGLAAVGASVPSAQAGTNILYTDITDLTMSATGQTLEFDIDHSGPAPYVQLNGSNTDPTWDFRFENTFGSTESLRASPRLGSSLAGYYMLKLTAGATIDSSMAWDERANYFEYLNTGAWNGGGEGYLGLRMRTGLVSAGTFFYGWALVNYDDAGNQLTLKSFALERTINTPIVAGDATSVPEPSSALLLALGAGGMALRRRREASAV